jgi:F-type H+/Na+-transporting ATPase subunit alpha
MIVSVSGLPGAKPEEIIIFENGLIGQVFGINENSIHVLIFSLQRPRIGEKAGRTDKTLEFPVGKNLLGKILNPLGKSILHEENTSTEFESSMPIEKQLISIDKLKTIDAPLSSGISIVDLLLPLGIGQKELIIGDRKTGKSSFLLTLMQSQINNSDHIIVYAVIGKKSSELKSVISFVKKNQIEGRMVIIAATSNDPTAMIYITPFAAMTVAEYFCHKQGKNVILILDDLTNHAKYYREISLLAGRFPGRESYPGDIFYTHARLLERAGNFKSPEFESSSITCFPVVETVESDLTGYIPTNLMGITDGHIFFDNNLFQEGKRPAINPFISVTRVGKQTQSVLKKAIIQSLTVFLNKYKTLQGYVRFGAELSPQIQANIDKGKAFEKFFNQPLGNPLPEEIQIVIFSLIWGNLVNENQIDQIKTKLTDDWQNPEEQEKMKAMINVQNLKDLVENIKLWHLNQSNQ